VVTEYERVRIGGEKRVGHTVLVSAVKWLDRCVVRFMSFIRTGSTHTISMLDVEIVNCCPSFLDICSYRKNGSLGFLKQIKYKK
jgi:hypothetical protein